jgi:hypothetical protein
LGGFEVYFCLELKFICPYEGIMAARIPPQNLEAEQSILGGLMLEAEAFDQVSDV